MLQWHLLLKDIAIVGLRIFDEILPLYNVKSLSFNYKLKFKLEQAVTRCLNSLPPRAHHSRARHRRAPGAYLQRAP